MQEKQMNPEWPMKENLDFRSVDVDDRIPKRPGKMTVYVQKFC